jgi:hypothetical protein
MLIRYSASILALAALAAAPSAEARHRSSHGHKHHSHAQAHAAARPSCDRGCLIDVAHRYMDALAAQKPQSLPWAETVRYSENSVPMAIGDGIWATASARSSAALEAADPSTGQVAWLGVVEEHGQPAFYAVRLKVEAGRISQAEAVVRRKGGPPQFGDTASYAHDAGFAQAGHESRKQLISSVDGYFAGLAGGKASPRFDPGCARQDNGLATTAGPGSEGGIEGCAAQFKARVFAPVARVRDLQHPIIDEARGVVVSTGFLDLPATSPKPVGKGLAWAADYPYSVGFITAFKIRDGRIFRIESVSGALPYGMPSPWR